MRTWENKCLRCLLLVMAVDRKRKKLGRSAHKHTHTMSCLYLHCMRAFEQTVNKVSVLHTCIIIVCVKCMESFATSYYNLQFTLCKALCVTSIERRSAPSTKGNTYTWSLPQIRSAVLSVWHLSRWLSFRRWTFTFHFLPYFVAS